MPIDRPTLVDGLHDLLCPYHSIFNRCYRGRDPIASLEIRKFSRSEDARRNEQNAFAALVHNGILAYSLYVPPL
jgi:hypothetical protein